MFENQNWAMHHGMYTWPIARHHLSLYPGNHRWTQIMQSPIIISATAATRLKHVRLKSSMLTLIPPSWKISTLRQNILYAYARSHAKDLETILGKFYIKTKGKRIWYFFFYLNLLSTRTTYKQPKTRKSKKVCWHFVTDLLSTSRYQDAFAWLSIACRR